MKYHPAIVLFGLLCTGIAQADIYKLVDKDGHVTYSSEPIKGGKKVYLKPLPTIPGGRPGRKGEPEDFPSVDSQTQKRRDSTRRLILNDELRSEENLLETARQNLKTLESNPEPLIRNDGVPNPNAGPYAEKLKAAQSDTSLHEQNIKALQTEISNLKN